MDPPQLAMSSDMRHSACASSCSGFSDSDTDWGKGESDDECQTLCTAKSTRIYQESKKYGVSSLDTGHVMSKMKTELVDRIMLEFWKIFDWDNETIISDDGTGQTKGGNKYQNSKKGQQGDDQTASYAQDKMTHQEKRQRGEGKRQRQQQDEDDEDDEMGNRNRKRRKNFHAQFQRQDYARKFACPYRKHDARKYCVRDWRSCALTPLDSVARVKAHLYRHHRIFQCQRCKSIFDDQQHADDHLKQPVACELFNGVQQDGITNEIVEKLRSKKKTCPNQSEEGRWKEIYRIIFPAETIPSPYFEEIQEDLIQSPDSRQLTDYEEYCRQELPRIFKASLEEIVHNSMQPLEEQLRIKLVELIRDSQDQVFANYRPNLIMAETPIGGNPGSSTYKVVALSVPHELIGSIGENPSNNSVQDGQLQAPTFFKPPSPQIHTELGLAGCSKDSPSTTVKENDRLDSEYHEISDVPVSKVSSIANISTPALDTSFSPEDDVSETGSAGNKFIHMRSYSDVSKEIARGGIEWASSTPRDGIHGDLWNMDFSTFDIPYSEDLDYTNLGAI